ncbi:MAG TPA: T9SS type A sorting domain-containing protein [Bacteroidales bacterium]|nr:T9SS type A sorting domain-containing protein [Bacteroidales bacterium]
MKRILLSLLFIALTTSGLLRAQAIPNASFENWTQDTITGFGGPVIYQHPVDWSPLSSLFNALFGGTINIFQTSVHYGSGNHGLMIEVGTDSIGADIFSMFPVSSLPQKLSGYYKYEGGANTAANVLVGFTDYDPVNDTSILIAQGTGSLVVTGSFTQFEIPIVGTGMGTPDSAIIMVEFMSGKPGSKLYLDALSFDGTSGLSKPGNLIGMELYPIPMQDELLVRWNASADRTYDIRLMSLTGQVMWEGRSSEGALSIPVNELPRGAYMLRLSDGQNVSTRKVIK